VRPEAREVVEGIVTDGELVAGPGYDHQPIILLVEDELLIRVSLAESLREAGFVVLEACNGEEGKMLISTGHPIDLVVSDVRMPGAIDGVEFSIWLKQFHPWVPIVLMSGHLNINDHPAQGFLRKPFQFVELEALIHELIDPEWLNKRNNRNAS
jgi:DNA-binding NtrC family response regulator